MAGYTLFDRQYRLAAGQGGKKGFEIGEVSETYPVPLHISFSIEKSDLTTQNTAKIEVWNLKKSHIAVLEKKKCIVSLRAGYGSNMALVFSGYVSFVSTVMDSSDRKTTIEVLDGLVAIKNTYVSVSYAGKVSWKTIFNDTAADMGVAVVYGSGISFKKVSKGYSFAGLAKTILNKGCKKCGLSWSIQNGVLQIKKKGSSISKKGYLLSADTGMVGIPEKVTITDDSDSSSNTVGYDVEYLMNAAIDVNDYVKLKSDIITGYFYVYSLQISGDNISGDWLCKARLLKLKKKK